MEHLNTPHSLVRCEECGGPLQNHYRFCPHCGARLAAETGQIDIFNNRPLRCAFVFYGIYLAICLVVQYTPWFYRYNRLFWVEIAQAVLATGFAWYNRKAIRPLLLFRSFQLNRLLGITALAVVFSCLVTLLVHQLNVSLFHSNISYYKGYQAYIAPEWVMLYSIALMPALFEELAFRGVLYQYLAEVLEEDLVMVLTGFAFAAMHLNFISLLWLAPFGIFLGYLRRRYHTLWYGIIFHFVFNFTACILNLYQEGVLP